MNTKQQIMDIMSNVRWCEARDGFIDHETRRGALCAVLGLLNRVGDARLKGMCMRAINENRRFV